MPRDLLATVLHAWPAELRSVRQAEIALSGGLDSVALLDLMARAREQSTLSLTAVHVHHGLSPNADQWQEHCEQLCHRLDVPLRVVNVSCQSRGLGLEADARRLRYQAYIQTEAQLIVLAHHQDDQAETILLQLLRGGGARALAAMPTLRVWREKLFWRPLLGYQRRQLEEYARWRKLVWVDDESNANIYWRRNWLRHVILPKLAATVVDYRAHFCRSATLMADAAHIVQEVAQQDFNQCNITQTQLNLERFIVLSPARQRQLLVFWLEHRGYASPTPEAIENFRRQVIEAAPDKQPLLELGGGHILTRFRQQLALYWLAPEQAPPIALPWPWDEGNVAGWSGSLAFIAHPRGIRTELLQRGFSLVPRHGGERLLTPVGRKPIKTLFQEQGIPPALRPYWPLLTLNDGRLGAVPSVAVASDCQSKDEQLGWWPKWQPTMPAPLKNARYSVE